MKSENLIHATELLQSGYSIQSVRKQMGITLAILHQLKRKVDVKGFGCVVCCAEKMPTNKYFCRKHAKRYETT